MRLSGDLYIVVNQHGELLDYVIDGDGFENDDYQAILLNQFPALGSVPIGSRAMRVHLELADEQN